MIPLHCIFLKNVPIFEQLKMEEGLLRTDDRNFCLINQGSSRSIVMGISGKPETLIDLSKAQKDQIPIIQRFSGGGTVIVDEQTLFVSFIFSKEALPVTPFPEPILRWTAELYQKAWKIPGFQLKENDYAIEDKKCGGNAQYIQKNRWLHHTTFLWDYQSQNMDYLLHPPKQPRYRNSRRHGDFLCRLKEYAPSQDFLIECLMKELGNVKPLYPTQFSEKKWEFTPHRQATRLLDWDK